MANYSTSVWLACQQHQFTQEAADILPSFQDSDGLNQQKNVEKNFKNVNAANKAPFLKAVTVNGSV